MFLALEPKPGHPAGSLGRRAGPVWIPTFWVPGSSLSAERAFSWKKHAHGLTQCRLNHARLGPRYPLLVHCTNKISTAVHTFLAPTHVERTKTIKHGRGKPAHESSVLCSGCQRLNVFLAEGTRFCIFCGTTENQFIFRGARFKINDSISGPCNPKTSCARRSYLLRQEVRCHASHRDMWVINLVASTKSLLDNGSNTGNKTTQTQ